MCLSHVPLAGCSTVRQEGQLGFKPTVPGNIHCIIELGCLPQRQKAREILLLFFFTFLGFSNTVAPKPSHVETCLFSSLRLLPVYVVDAFYVGSYDQERNSLRVTGLQIIAFLYQMIIFKLGKDQELLLIKRSHHENEKVSHKPGEGVSNHRTF